MVAYRRKMEPTGALPDPPAHEQGGAEVRLILLPGLGADGRLFGEQARAFPNLESPALIAARRGESLREYAARFADTLDLRGPLVLGGFSFGGMLAMEIVKAIGVPSGVQAVVSISGCRSKRAITPEFRRRARQVQALPPALVSAGLRLFSLRFGASEALTSEQRAVLRAMSRDADPRFFQWAAKACADWPFRGPDEEIPGIPVHQVHGEKDQTIPMVDGDPDTILAGGGHLIQFTHAAQVNAVLSKALRGLPV